MSDKFPSEDEAISSSYEKTVIVGDKSKKSAWNSSSPPSRVTSYTSSSPGRIYKAA